MRAFRTLEWVFPFRVISAFGAIAAIALSTHVAWAEEPVAVEATTPNPDGPTPTVPLAQPGETSRDSYILVPPTPTPLPTVAPDTSAPDGDWYGHWHLLTGTVLTGLYALAVYGTYHAEGDDQVGAGIGTGYLLLGSAVSGAAIHAAYDSEVEAVLSAVLKVVGGAVFPAVVASACEPSDGDSCDVAVTMAAGLGTGVPVLLDAFVLAWE